MIKVGTEVGWPWGNSIATGTVKEIHPERHEIVSKGKHIVRNGSKDDPALLIVNDDNAHILKLAHEVQELSKTTSS